MALCHQTLNKNLCIYYYYIMVIITYSVLYCTVYTPLKIGKTKTICPVLLSELLWFTHPRSLHCFVLIHRYVFIEPGVAVQRAYDIIGTQKPMISLKGQ